MPSTHAGAGGTDPFPTERADPVAVRACWQAYPAAGRVGFQRARVAIGEALAVLKGRDEPDPAAWLLGRVRAFASSPAGKRGKFTPHAANWFADGRYDDDPAAWERSDVGDKPEGMTPEKLARILEAQP